MIQKHLNVFSSSIFHIKNELRVPKIFTQTKLFRLNKAF
jgi:hypothetical protein